METVKRGQVWQDWDCRIRNVQPPRLLRVLLTGKDKALCVDIGTHKETLIRLDRFKPTSSGYKLFKDV